MSEANIRGSGFAEADLDFVVGEVAPTASNKESLKRLLREDEGFRKALVGDEKVFQRVMNDEEILLKVSPSLYFEVLLRKALREMETATHTLERAGRQSIPVFDTKEVVGLLARPEVLSYMAQMLASFIRIHSYVMPVRVRPGIRRRIRYNDMDVDSLLRFCANVDEGQRFGFYKRIADVCLFISGVFPDYTYLGYRYPASSGTRSISVRRGRRSLEEYEQEGRRFYGLAERHPAARTLQLSDVFGLLRLHFTSARKPLSFIATHYLNTRKQAAFGFQEP
jgi:hypothetical protein